MSCSFKGKKDSPFPSEISYSSVPGFSQRRGNVLEWTSVTARNKGEPLVPSSLQPPLGLKIRWLGTSGFELSDDSTTILIDPFISRPNFLQFFTPLTIDTSAVKHYILSTLQLKNLAAILVSHAHHDHFQDVPYILAQFPEPEERPLVVGSRNVHDLVMKYRDGIGIKWVDSIGGLKDTQTKILVFSSGQKTCLDNSRKVACEVGKFGEFTITAFASDHSSYDYLGPTALEGAIKSKPPFPAAAYKMRSNTSIGYLVEYQGLRIFFSETPILKHANNVGKVDILLQGIASRKGYNNISKILASLKPTYVIPSHYDNFFKSINEFQKFDYRIGLGPVDFSRFKEFLHSFEDSYINRARPMISQDGLKLEPKLRLMKLFYYYSLNKILPQ